ncbi:SHOCT domain-containing protein, partial [Kitasatospora sp. NPDC057541]
MRYWNGHGYGHGFGGWGLGLMALGLLLVVLALVAVAVVLVRQSRAPGPPSKGAWVAGPPGPPGPPAGAPSGPLPEQVLAERFARGEIDAEEYRHRLDVLRETGGGPTPGAPPPV